MNRKNTILIAVAINAGLLAILLVAALTTQEDLPLQNQIAKEDALVLPKIDDTPLYQDLPLLNLPEVSKIETVSVHEPVLHSLPPLVSESVPAPILAPIAKVEQVAPLNQITVKKGDSLEKIARENQTSVDAIIKLNHLPSSFLKVGQVLKMPAERIAVKSAEKKVADLGPEYYTMKVGENPWAIAIRHHMKVDELLKLNGLNEEKARKLKPGDRLRIR
jgi:LysM repeat protein